MCKWSIPNWFENLHDIQNIAYYKHLSSEFLIGYVSVGVNPCERCIVVAPPPQIARLPNKSQNNGFKICELIWVGILHILLKEGNILSFGDDLSGISIKKKSNSNSFF